MSFRYCFDLSYNIDRLTVDFSDKSPIYYYSSKTRSAPGGLYALDALLAFKFNLNTKTDYEIQKDEPFSTKINIFRTPNIIVVLDFLLSDANAGSFYYYEPYRSDQDPKHRWRVILRDLIVYSIGNTSFSADESNRIKPIIRIFLDYHYEDLKKDPLVIGLPNKANGNYGDDFLKHPLYQTISLLWEDYQTRLKIHNAKGLIDRFTSPRPNEAAYLALCKKYLSAIPDCYLDVRRKSADEDERSLNFEKIKQSIPQVPDTNNSVVLAPQPLVENRSGVSAKK